MSGNTMVVVEVGSDGVAIVSINNPPLNLLSAHVMIILKEKIEEALSRDDVKAIVITGSKGKFSGGFNVTAFGGSSVKKTRKELGFMSIEIITDTFEAARKPLVAAIDGLAFGGGLEIALACHARISTSTAQLGLTELQYGIIPGFGGTQRLPRLIGLSKSLEMILMSKRVSGEEARRLCLVDAIVPSEILLKVARQWALDILECRKPWTISLYKTGKLEPLGEARAILKSARQRFQKENPNLIHPLVCIDVVESGIVSGPRNALWKEAEALQELRQSSTCRSLVHVFFAQRQISKIPGTSEMNLQPRKISKVAVVGGGLMSSHIVVMLLLKSYQVILKEKDNDRLFHEINKIKGSLQNHVMKGKETQERVEKAFNLLERVLDCNELKDVDLVIEHTVSDYLLEKAVTMYKTRYYSFPDPSIYLNFVQAESENLPSKQEIFVNIEKYCTPHCVFTSSSSKFSLKQIGEMTRCQNRIARVNFFCPSPGMPLMEIIHTKNTSLQVITDLMHFGKKMRKTPFVIGEWKGYPVRNMFITYLRGAILLADQGVDVYLIDEAFTKFGMQLGPFRMIDMLGFEIFAELCATFAKNCQDTSNKPELISVLQRENREGECNGKGFYKYDNCGKAIPDPDSCKYQDKTRSSTDVTIGSKATKVPDGDIIEMILFPALNEACRIISEGVLVRSSDLDVASVLGMSFPSYRGGIMYWSDSIGSKHICSKLEKWSKFYGYFFKTSAYLLERASKGASLANPVKQAKSQL